MATCRCLLPRRRSLYAFYSLSLNAQNPQGVTTPINTAQNASNIALLYPAPCVVMAVPYNTSRLLSPSFPPSRPRFLPWSHVGADARPHLQTARSAPSGPYGLWHGVGGGPSEEPHARLCERDAREDFACAQSRRRCGSVFCLCQTRERIQRELVRAVGPAIATAAASATPTAG